MLKSELIEVIEGQRKVPKTCLNIKHLSAVFPGCKFVHGYSGAQFWTIYARDLGHVSMSDKSLIVRSRKVLSRDIGSLVYRVAFMFESHFGSTATEVPVAFQSDRIILNTNHAIETGSWTQSPKIKNNLFLNALAPIWHTYANKLTFRLALFRTHSEVVRGGL